jgi:hypothetical protein
LAQSWCNRGLAFDNDLERNCHPIVIARWLIPVAGAESRQRKFGRVNSDSDGRSGVFAEQLPYLPLSSQEPQRIVNSRAKPDRRIRAAHPGLEAMPRSSCNRHGRTAMRFCFFASRR